MKGIPLFALLLAACNATTRYAGRPTDEALHQIDDEMRGSSATVELAADGALSQVNELAFDVDGAGWTDANGARVHRGWGEIQRISTRSYFLGFLRGRGVGAAIGGATGYAVVAAHPCQSSCWVSPGLGAFLFGVPAGIVGGIIGLGVPYRRTVEAAPPR
jgi:hypothetical protein